MPKEIWIEKRIEDLQRSIVEYTQAGLKVNEEWVKELNEHISW